MKKNLVVISIILFFIQLVLIVYDATNIGSGNEGVSLLIAFIGSIIYNGIIIVGVLLLLNDLYNRRRIPSISIFITLGIALILILLVELIWNEMLFDILVIIFLIGGIYFLFQDIKSINNLSND